MNGHYLASQIRYFARPITAFREYAMRDVLPAFGNIDERATQVGNDYYQRIGSQPACEDDIIDMADVAEVAEDRARDWWEMMTSLRQSMLNLMAAGLFHLVEQQLARVSHDALFNGPVKDSKLSDVERWYRQNANIDLTGLPSWRQIDEMRLVANTIKHGEGGSAGELKQLRPDLFADPSLKWLHDAEGLSMLERMAVPRMAAPLSGDDFFVTEDILRTYAESAEAFLEELAQEFIKQG